MKLSLEDAAVAMGASTALQGEVSSYSIDSRTLVPGDLFFALRGDRHDGHDYVRKALEMGAAAVVVDRDCGDDPRVIKTGDSLRAIQSLAQWARCRWGGLIVAITGSAGKTSTKDIIASLLASVMTVGRTLGNFNNHIGVPLSILRVPDDARVAVLEMGMNHAGEIRDLCRIARPEIGVVTNIGYAHVENFETGIEGIASAKGELIESLPPGGIAVLNYDDPRTRALKDRHTGRTLYYGFSPEADVRAVEISRSAEGVTFRSGDTLFQTVLTGRHAVSNILAGLSVARLLDIDDSRLQEAVGSLRPGNMRGEITEHHGIRIINDCYNSNPEAVRGMLDVLAEIPAQRRIAVLGEMLELGRLAEPLHRDAGGYAARCGISVLVGIRGEAQAFVRGALDAGLRQDAAYFFENSEQAGLWLRSFARPGDAILFKGSRGTRVEKALETFLEQGSG